MKIVIDTNVLISGVFWKGPARRILELWMEGRFEAAVSPALLEEYEEVLRETEVKMNSGVTEGWRMFIAENATVVQTSGELKVCRDPDDDELLNCAVAAAAGCVVSGDKDLLVLGEVSGVEILTPRAFLDRHFPGA